MREDDSAEKAVPVRWAVSALVAGLAALLLQQLLVPFTAAPQFGLLVNQGDLEIYRNAARLVLDAQPLYAEPVPPGGWFTYPPFAALCFLPFAVAPFAVVKVAWFAVTCVALWATIRRCARVLGYRRDAALGLLCLGLAFVAADLEAVRGTLWQGQVNLVLMAILVWDLTRPESARWRGFSVGLVAGVKLTAIVFLPYLLLTRQWRAAVAAVVTGLATLALAGLILPGDSRDFWRGAAGDVDRIGPVTHPGNQSINGVLANLRAPEQVPSGLWAACVVVAAALGYAAAVVAHRTGRPLLAVAVVGLLGCAVPPLAWGHHWVWFVPLLMVLLHEVVHADRRRALPAAATAATFAAASMWLTGWLYREIEHLGLTGAPSYVPAMTAATLHMSHPVRAVVCGVPVAVFLVVAITILAGAATGRRAADSDNEQALVPARADTASPGEVLTRRPTAVDAGMPD